MSKLRKLVRYDWPVHFFLLLTNWLPDNMPFLRLRGWLIQPFLGSCGRDLRLGRNITFYNPKEIHFGSNIYVAYGCWFMAGAPIQVDDEVIFGPYCIIVSSQHIRQNGSFRYGQAEIAPVQIRRGAWIAAHVTVTAGSFVGVGTLIAANSVVHGDIPDNVLAGGQPARILKTYDEESSDKV